MNFKKHLANIITSWRLIFSIALLYVAPLSISFYVLYVLAGTTDMVDGAVARKTHTESEFGATLDTVADFVFVVVCLVKLLPVLHIEWWAYVSIAVVAIIKVVNFLFGFATQKKFVSVHSIMNKVVGAMLFALPLTLSFVEYRYFVMAICAVSICAAIQEGYFVLKAGKGADFSMRKDVKL